MDAGLLEDLHRVDQLRQAAAAAAPAIERLVAAGVANGLSARESHRALGTGDTVARWCAQQLRTLETGDAEQLALAAVLAAVGVEAAA